MGNNGQREGWAETHCFMRWSLLNHIDQPSKFWNISIIWLSTFTNLKKIYI